jgi:hypothetical protein
MFQIVITPKTKEEAQRVASLTQMLADTFAPEGEAITVTAAVQKTLSAKSKKIEEDEEDDDDEEDVKPAKKGSKLSLKPAKKKPVEEDEDEEEEDDEDEDEEEEEVKPAKKGPGRPPKKKAEEEEEDDEEEEEVKPAKKGAKAKSSIDIDALRKLFQKAKTANERKAKKVLEKFKVTSLVNLEPAQYDAFAAELKKIS